MPSVAPTGASAQQKVTDTTNYPELDRMRVELSELRLMYERGYLNGAGKDRLIDLTRKADASADLRPEEVLREIRDGDRVVAELIVGVRK
jgi:hypothetical protein